MVLGMVNEEIECFQDARYCFAKFVKKHDLGVSFIFVFYFLDGPEIHVFCKMYKFAIITITEVWVQ